jgi:hypothetical protein
LSVHVENQVGDFLQLLLVVVRQEKDVWTLGELRGRGVRCVSKLWSILTGEELVTLLANVLSGSAAKPFLDYVCRRTKQDGGNRGRDTVEDRS